MTDEINESEILALNMMRSSEINKGSILSITPQNKIS